MEHEFLIAWVKAVFTTIGIGALLTACLAFKQKTMRDTIIGVELLVATILLFVAINVVQ